MALVPGSVLKNADLGSRFVKLSGNFQVLTSDGSTTNLSNSTLFTAVETGTGGYTITPKDARGPVVFDNVQLTVLSPTPENVFATPKVLTTSNGAVNFALRTAAGTAVSPTSTGTFVHFEITYKVG